MPRKVVDRNTIDARGARIALMMYLRWLWVPVIALAAGFFVGGTFSTFEGPSSDASANITVGLTEEVRWPFFDAVLSRQSGLIEDGSLAEEASAQTDIEHVSVSVESSNVQNSTLQIVAVVRGGVGDAQTYANALGELLVEANLASQRDSLVADASSLTREITDLQAQVVELETEFDQLDDQWLTVQNQLVVADPEDRPELQLEVSDIDNQRRVVQRQIDAQRGLETTLSTQLTQTQIQADQTGAPIEVSSSAVAEGSSANDLRPIFAVLFFLLSLIAIPFLEQIFGKVRSLDHLGNLWPEARLVDARNRRLEKATINPIDVARLAVAAESTPGQSIAVAGLASSKVTDLLAQSLADQGTETSIVELSSTAGMEQVVASDQLALVVPTGRVALRRAHRAVDNLDTLSADPVVVVLASKDKGNGVIHTSYGSLAEGEEPASIRSTEIIPVEMDIDEIGVEEEPEAQKDSRWGAKNEADADGEPHEDAHQDTKARLAAKAEEHRKANQNTKAKLEAQADPDDGDDSGPDSGGPAPETKKPKKSKNSRSKKGEGRAA